MALQRKSVSLVTEYEYICQQDDAVDTKADGFEEKWQHYLDGAGDCPLVVGGKPTKFKLRHLDNVARSRMMRYLARAQEDEACFWEAAFAAFALAVVDVENFTDLDGKPARLKFDTDDEGPHKVYVLHRDSVNLFEMPWILEVGGRVIQRMNPDPK